MLCARYTLGGTLFPDPEDKRAWFSCPLWWGRDPTQSISYDQHRDRLAGYFSELGFHFIKKTHAFRVLAARSLDMAGVDDSVSGCSPSKGLIYVQACGCKYGGCRRVFGCKCGVAGIQMVFIAWG